MLSSPLMSGDSITELMRSQWGLISRTQARGTGMSTSTVKRRVRDGTWQTVGCGVYRAATSTHSGSWEERVMAACLQAGPEAVASHRTAACLWRLDDFFFRKPEPIEITLPRGRRIRLPKNATFYATRTPIEHPATKQNIPCTNLPRTLIDLAQIVTHAQVEAALDSALRMKSIWRKWIRDEVEQLPLRHPSRAAVLKLLNERDFSFDSKPEIDVDKLVWAAGVRGAQVHYVIRDEVKDQHIANVDFAVPRLKLFIQFHGLHDHLKADRLCIDSWQVSQLSARGWTPIITTKKEVERNPVGFMENLRNTYERLEREAARGAEPILHPPAPVEGDTR